MSASAPKHPADKPERERKEGKAPWLGLSLLAHGAILGWLIYLVPPKELASFMESGEAAPAAASASAEKVREVAQQIEQTQAGEIRSKVEELLQTEAALAELQAKTQAEFADLAGDLAQDAPLKMEAAASEAAAAQAEAEAAMAEALKAAGFLAQAQAAGPENQAQITEAAAQLKAAQEKAKNAQAAATAAQTTAAQQLGFLGGEAYQRARESQTQAVEAQQAANREQDEAAAKTAELPGLKRAAERANETATRAQRIANQTQDKIASQQKGAANLEATIRQNQAKLQQNPKDADKINKAIDAANAKLQSVQGELAKNHQKLPEAQAKAAETAAAAQQAARAAEAAPAQIAAAQEEALKAQQAAKELQGKARSLAANAADSGAPQTAEAASSPEAPVPGAENLDGKSFAELYNMAVETEQGIAERFQTIRAAQVAVQRQIPLAEAQKYVEIAKPVRGNFPANSEGVSDAAGLEAQNRAMEGALQELDSMVALARGMAFQARNSGGAQSQGVDVSLEGMKLQAEQMGQLTNAATDYQDGMSAVDLTGMMRAAMAGEAFPGGPIVGEGGGAGEGAGAGPPSGVGASGRGGPGQGSGLPGGSASGAGQGFAYGGRGSGPAGVPPPGNVVDSVPGRKVYTKGTGSGTGSKWMFVDSWYVLGPFPNPQRRNLDTKFPPESVVDLDAVYPVEGGTVRWQFVQNGKSALHPPVERPYAIYYAYTTLWFDQPREMWIAVGSDDYSKLWINDLPVWASGPAQKVWRPDEGYRKVYFKQGLNRILYRVENGQNACMFSFMLNMQASGG
jgi:hypothetical protein